MMAFFDLPFRHLAKLIRELLGKLFSGASTTMAGIKSH